MTHALIAFANIPLGVIGFLTVCYLFVRWADRKKKRDREKVKKEILDTMLTPKNWN